MPAWSRPTVLIDAACAGGDVRPTPAPSSSIPGKTSDGTRTDSKSANHHRPASATREPTRACTRAPMNSVSRPPAAELRIMATVSASSAWPTVRAPIWRTRSKKTGN